MSGYVRKEPVRLRDMSPEDIRKMTKTEFDAAFASDRLTTVRDAVEWLSRQDPDAGLFYFDRRMNAWVDLPKSMLRTAEDEKARERARAKAWDSDGRLGSETGEREFERFRYVSPEDICIGE